jgi:hypothetical protein
MKLSDKALGKIGLELLGHAARGSNQDEPVAARQKRVTPTRDLRARVYSRDRKATVLTFRKRHR